MKNNIREYINNKFLHPTSTGIGNIPSLDGLRGVAILMVVYSHFFAHSTSEGSGFPLVVHGFDVGHFILVGHDGVRLFFVLSAFLLFMPYVRASRYGGRDVLTSRFYKRRVLRIVPAYYLITVFYIAAVLLLGQHYGSSPFNIYNILSNVLFLPPFLAVNKKVFAEFIPGTWSLVAEAHYYLILPFIASLFTGVRRAFVTTAVVVVVNFFYRVAVNKWVGSVDDQFVLDHNLIGYMELFALGMLASLLYSMKEADDLKIPGWTGYPLVALGVGLYWWKLNIGPAYLYWNSLLVAFSFFFVILGVASCKTFISRVMEWSPLRLIGIISYSMFLMNTMLAWYVLNPLADALSIKEPLHRFAFNMTVGLVMLLSLSTLSYLFIERPFLAKKVPVLAPNPARAEELT